MKKCEYCAKELDSYHLQYCKDTECEEKAIAFYDRRRENENLFGVLNIISIIAIMAGLIIAVFSPVVGNIIVSAALVVLGITVLILPFAPENFYQKYRIKKTTEIVRAFGIFLFSSSSVFAGLAIYYAH